jgi:hypothetical protein
VDVFTWKQVLGSPLHTLHELILAERVNKR